MRPIDLTPFEILGDAARINAILALGNAVDDMIAAPFTIETAGIRFAITAGEVPGSHRIIACGADDHQKINVADRMIELPAERRLWERAALLDMEIDEIRFWDLFYLAEGAYSNQVLLGRGGLVRLEYDRTTRLWSLVYRGFDWLEIQRMDWQSNRRDAPDQGSELICVAEGSPFDSGRAAEQIQSHEAKIALDRRFHEHVRILQALEHGRINDVLVNDPALASSLAGRPILRS